MYFGLAFALIATIGSVFNLSKIAKEKHLPGAPKSLSERAALETRLLRQFRTTLLTCSTLFAIAIYGFIAPQVTNGWWVAGAWTLTYIGIIIAAVLPATGKTFVPHVVAATTMGIGMVLLALTFWMSFSGVSAAAELSITAAMALLGILTFVDTKRYIFYELALLYLNHVSIVVATLALLNH